MPVDIGKKAPDFKLFDTEKKEIALKDFHGKKVVLLFFPLAFTNVCTKELCEARDSITFFNETNASVIAVSTDSLFALKKYKESLDINFILLSDYNKEVAPLYDSLYDIWGFNYKGVCKRSSFVIDEEGIIRHMEILPSTDMYPDFTAIQQALTNLKSV